MVDVRHNEDVLDKVMKYGLEKKKHVGAVSNSLRAEWEWNDTGKVIYFEKSSVKISLFYSTQTRNIDFLDYPAKENEYYPKFSAKFQEFDFDPKTGIFVAKGNKPPKGPYTFKAWLDKLNSTYTGE